MSHKKQHYVPATYLRAWCDPNSPPNYDPYVWVLPKNGGKAKNRAPEKIFRETDFYTTKGIDGERDLNIEKGLSQLESQFSNIRQRKLSKKELLSPKEKGTLCTFVAAMYTRTKSRREFIREQWQQALEIGNKMAEWSKNATQEQRSRMSSALGPHNPNVASLSLDDIANIVNNPSTSFLATEITTIAPALYRMRSAILCSNEPSTFITSDDPCVWFDPDLFQEPHSFGAGGLISPSIEISLPLSPTQYILFGKYLIFDGLYIPIESDNPIIDLINRRTWENTDEYYIDNKESNNYSWLAE